MIPFIKVIHIDPQNGEDRLEKELISIQISKGSEATKNTLTIELQNPNGKYTNRDPRQQFTVNDSSIIIYMDWVPITNQEPIISGTVSSVEFPTNASGKYKLKIKATDKTGLLLSKLWSESITHTTGFDAPDAIINLVGHLNDLDGDASNGIQLGKHPLTTNNVSLTKQNGAPFPKPISIAKIWKPGYEWLNDLSQPEYTGEDRPYVYWIDQNNDLHWHYPYQKPSTSLTSQISTIQTTIPVKSTIGYPESGIIVIDDEVIQYGSKDDTNFLNCIRGAKLTNPQEHLNGRIVSGLYLFLGRQDIYSLNVSTTEDASYNFIIFNGGPTPKGYELLDYTLDESQIGKKFRMKFFDWKSVAKSMMDYEKARGDWIDKDSNYPPSYPWNVEWDDDPINNDTEYQASFEEEVRRRCLIKAGAYFVTGKQKYKADVQLRGTTAYDVNDLVNIVTPKFNKTLILRVKDVKHQLNKGSWITDISLEEDGEALNPEVL